MLYRDNFYFSGSLVDSLAKHRIFFVDIIKNNEIAILCFMTVERCAFLPMFSLSV